MDDALSELPKKKAKLKETRSLLERLEARQGEVSADRYQRLCERYQSQIESLGKIKAELTERGETQKIELEDRLAMQRDRKQVAENELAEIEALHEQGAMDEETYRNQQRDYRGDVRQADKKIRKHVQKLDELNYYLNEVGEEPYRGNTLKGQLSAAGEQLKNLTAGNSGNLEETFSTVGQEARRYGENIRSRVNEWAAEKNISILPIVGGLNRKNQKKRGVILTVLGGILLVVGIVASVFNASLEAELNNPMNQLGMMFDPQAQQEAAATNTILSLISTGGLAVGIILLIVGIFLLLSLPSDTSIPTQKEEIS
jgi:hypothetical protein